MSGFNDHDDREGVYILETCRLIGIVRSKYYELLRDGKLKSVKVGKRRLVTPRSCRALFRGAR